MNDHPLLYLLYGLVSGFSQFVPVSASAHQSLFYQLLGLDSSHPFLLLFVHGGALGAFVWMYRKRLLHIRRELQIASLPVSRRKRPADMNAVLDAKLTMAALLPVLVGAALSIVAIQAANNLVWMSLLLIGSATYTYLPDYRLGGDRSGSAMSPMDGLLMGLMAGLSVIPGLSAVGGMLALGLLRKCDRSYILEIAYLIMALFLAGLMVTDFIAVFVVGLGTLSVKLLLCSLLAAATAFGGGVAAMLLMRYLSVRDGFSGFSYYGWGLGLLIFILYLML